MFVLEKSKGGNHMLQVTYFILCILGFTLPLSQFIPFLVEHGLNLELFINQLLINRISAFFGMDVVISAVVVITLIFAEGRRIKMSNLWIPIICLTVGVSFSLPVFLFMRQRHLEQKINITNLI
jgi:Terpene cyclase DEP1